MVRSSEVPFDSEGPRKTPRGPSRVNRLAQPEIAGDLDMGARAARTASGLGLGCAWVVALAVPGPRMSLEAPPPCPNRPDSCGIGGPAPRHREGRPTRPILPLWDGCATISKCLVRHWMGGGNADRVRKNIHDGAGGRVRGAGSRPQGGRLLEALSGVDILRGAAGAARGRD